MFTHANLLLQWKNPCKYLVLERFIRNLWDKFLKLKESSKADRITDVDTKN